VSQFELRRIQPVFFQLPGDQIPLGDLHFFFLRITVQLNNFQPVQQRRGNRIQHIGCSNKHNPGKIERHIQIMIRKSIVLLWIKHLQQRRGRIASKIAADLVYFIQHEDRIVRFRPSQSLNDATGQSTDISAAMAADFRFVAHTAQRNAHELALQRSGN